MSDSSPSLTDQLAARVKTFCQNSKLTYRQLCKFLKIDEGNFNGFLHGRNGLSAERTLRLLQLMNLGRRDLELKFANPDRLTSRIMKLQECHDGQPVIRFDNDGWYPGTGGSGAGMDPNDAGDDITSVRSTGSQGDDPDYDDLTRTLAQVQALHRQAISTIEDYEARQRARVNSSGTTGPGRMISRPSTPGPRSDLFP